MPSALADNLRAVRDRIAAAARRAGRSADAVRLVAVTKSVAPDVASELARAGQLDLGESRVTALEEKAAALTAAGLAPRWHFVGHVQRNKARRVAGIAALVHTLDSARLLEALDEHALALGRELEVLVQVKLSDEDAKTGLPPGELGALLARARGARALRAVGLMAMAPLETDPARREAAARAVFRACARLAREHAAAFARAPELSMGMSGDFETAIEEGATIVRVGTQLFAAPEERA